MESEESEERAKVLALIILCFSMIGLPGLTISFCVITAYAVYNWFLLLRSASEGNLAVAIGLSLVSVISFFALRKLIAWLRK